MVGEEIILDDLIDATFVPSVPPMETTKVKSGKCIHGTFITGTVYDEFYKTLMQIPTIERLVKTYDRH